MIMRDGARVHVIGSLVQFGCMSILPTGYTLSFHKEQITHFEA